VFRHKTIGNLFYDFNINNTIKVKTEDRTTILKYPVRNVCSPENQFTFLPDSLKYIDQTVYIGNDGKIVN